jgi:hypothetical protein
MKNQKTDYTIEDFGHDMANLTNLETWTESEVSQKALNSNEDDDMIFMYTNHEEGC